MVFTAKHIQIELLKSKRNFRWERLKPISPNNFRHSETKSVPMEEDHFMFKSN